MPTIFSSAAADFNIFNIVVVVSALLGEELTGGMIKVIEESLKAVDSQQANTEKYSSLDKGPATYSVVKRARDNDADLHSNNTVCFSLSLIIICYFLLELSLMVLKCFYVYSLLYYSGYHIIIAFVITGVVISLQESELSFLFCKLFFFFLELSVCLLLELSVTTVHEILFSFYCCNGNI